MRDFLDGAFLRGGWPGRGRLETTVLYPHPKEKQHAHDGGLERRFRFVPAYSCVGRGICTRCFLTDRVGAEVAFGFLAGVSCAGWMLSKSLAGGPAASGAGGVSSSMTFVPAGKNADPTRPSQRLSRCQAPP